MAAAAPSSLTSSSNSVVDVAILGGGQLGRMMIEAAHRLGLTARALDPGGAASPAGQVGHGAGATGSFRDAAAVEGVASGARVVTVEIEHVDTSSLMALEAKGCVVQPKPATIALIQDKFAQKQALAAVPGVRCGPFMDVPTEAAAAEAGEVYGYPFMLKARRMAYDGKGNAVVHSPAGICAAFVALGSAAQHGGVYAEKWVPFTKELAVMVARSASGDDVRAYPVVETIQSDNICHVVLAPAQISDEVCERAQALARATVGALEGAGIFGVEMFLTESGEVLLNEVAPRPHNSGHYTIEACETDQHEQHLRCVLGLPLGSCALRVGAALMVNFLGEAEGENTLARMRKALAVPGAALHWYGKAAARKGRKMGHVTVVAPTMSELARRATVLETATGDNSLSGIVKVTAAVPSTATTATDPPLPSGGGGGVQVGIIMGSDSDLPTMRAAASVLEELGVDFELTVVSAHRTPTRMYEYARTAAGRGLKVIIAGAGGAAHLPGMVAALTPLPVIGVPVKTSTLSGVDSLYSIVQMPRGVPVATVAIGNAKNAGLLAVRTLGAFDHTLMARLEAWHAKQETEVLGKASALEQEGWREYMRGRMGVDPDK